MRFDVEAEASEALRSNSLDPSSLKSSLDEDQGTVNMYTARSVLENLDGCGSKDGSKNAPWHLGEWKNTRISTTLALQI